ncbi:MAG: sugar phosphate nucleotidyltransferase, partial [Oceanidesulfovibrio sp.]
MSSRYPVAGPHVAVIPAAGYGTRMRGVDPSLPPGLPKELLPLAGMPIIFHSLLMAMEAGARHAAVVLRPGKECLRRLLSDPETAASAFPQSASAAAAIAASLTLHFCYQETPRGECDALAHAWPVIREHAAGAPVAVVYPDNFAAPRPGCRPVLQALAAAAAATGLETVALMDPGPEPRDDISDSGRVRLCPWSGSPVLFDGSRYPAAVHEVGAFLHKAPGMFAPRFPGELRT